MNQVFNINRFGNFIKKEFLEQRKFIILSSCAILGILSIISFLLFKNLDNPHYDDNIEWALNDVIAMYFFYYLIGLFIIGIIMHSITFSNIHKKNKSTYYFLQPVSMFEKFLSKILINGLLFYIIYTLIFLFLKQFTDLWIVSQLPKLSGKIPFLPLIPSYYTHINYVFLGLIFIFLIHTIYFAGSVTFKKFNFLIVSIVIGIILIISGFYIHSLTEYISGNATSYDSLGIFNDSIVYNNLSTEKGFNLTSYVIDLNTPFVKLIRLIEMYAFIPLLWIYSWFRFKEKQI